MIAMSYAKLAVDLEPGNTILCSDGTITMTVLDCHPEKGMVKARCENTAMLGEKKNVNLPGIVVDLPTITQKDIDDIMQWGVPNKIDFIAASFVRKGSDVVTIKKLLGEASDSIHVISKVSGSTLLFLVCLEFSSILGLLHSSKFELDDFLSL